VQSYSFSISLLDKWCETELYWIIGQDYYSLWRHIQQHTNTQIQKKPKWIYNQCNTLDSTTDITICVNVRKTSVAESQQHEMIVQHTNTKTAEIHLKDNQFQLLMKLHTTSSADIIQECRVMFGVKSVSKSLHLRYFTPPTGRTLVELIPVCVHVTSSFLNRRVLHSFGCVDIIFWDRVMRM